MTPGKIGKLRYFLLSHPPLVVLIFCIGLTAVAFVSFAYYIKLLRIHNTNLQMDWNMVFHNATKLNFCSSQKNNSQPFDENLFITEIGSYVNVSAHVSIMLHIPYSLQKKQSISSGISVINASYLGYAEPLRNKPVKMQFFFKSPLTVSCAHEMGCEHAIDACVVIQAPYQMFPSTVKPGRCPTANDNSTLSFVGISTDEEKHFEECPGLSLMISRNDERRLFVYLTVETKSLVHMHLMHSSYFLFLVVIIVLLFGSFRGGHQYHDKRSSIQYS